jgi:integrase
VIDRSESLVRPSGNRDGTEHAHADEWEWIDKAPKVKLFKEGAGRERSITPEQVVALLGELPTHQRDVVIFAFATGLRQSNVMGLKWSHVNLETGHAGWARINRRVASRLPCH